MEAHGRSWKVMKEHLSIGSVVWPARALWLECGNFDTYAVSIAVVAAAVIIISNMW